MPYSRSVKALSYCRNLFEFFKKCPALVLFRKEAYDLTRVVLFNFYKKVEAFRIEVLFGLRMQHYPIPAGREHDQPFVFPQELNCANGIELIFADVAVQNGGINRHRRPGIDGLQAPRVTFGLAAGMPDAIQYPGLQVQTLVAPFLQLIGELKEFALPSFKSAHRHEKPYRQSGMFSGIILLVTDQDLIIPSERGTRHDVTVEYSGFVEHGVQRKEPPKRGPHERPVIPHGSVFGFDKRDQFVFDEAEEFRSVA